MKKGLFVEGLSNEQRLLAGLRAKKNRANAEETWLIVQGQPGWGKTETTRRLQVQENAVSCRAKAHWTANSALRDICSALNIKAASRTDDMLTSVCSELLRSQPILMIDEIDHAARKMAVLETLRDITDTSEVVMIGIGTQDVKTTLNRYPHIRRRTSVVNFSPLTDEDVRKVINRLADVQIDDSMIPLMQRYTQGNLSAIRKAIVAIEERFRSSRSPITADMWGTRPVLAEDGTTQPKLVVNNA